MVALPETRQPINAGSALRRLRQRCIAGAGIAALGYIATFIADIVRGTPSDNAIVFGVEIAFAAVGLACVVVLITTWAMTANAEYARSMWTAGAWSHARNEKLAQEAVRVPELRTHDQSPR